MIRKLFWMIFVAPVAGATAFSAGAEETQNTAAAQPAIQMSEWGRETRLSELAAPARVSAQNSETGIPGFGDFLAEEARTLGAGALDSGQLRGMMAPGHLCRTPLHHARGRQRAQILVEAGAIINPRMVANNSSDNGKTPMDTVGNSEARAYLQSLGGCYGSSHSSTPTPRCLGNGGSYQCPNSGATAQ